MRNYYDILGVRQNATDDEIRTAFRQAALRSHPDRGGDHVSMVQVNEAYAILKDPVLRAEYDRYCSQNPTADSESQWQAHTASVREAAQDYPVKWSDFERWIGHLTDDVANAKYGTQSPCFGILLPKVEGSVSGVMFCLVGAALGIGILGWYSGLYPAALQSSRKNPAPTAWDPVLKLPISCRALALFSPILLGTWAGFHVHKVIHGMVKKGARDQADPLADAAPTANSTNVATEVILCRTCGQKLRVPTLHSELVVTCPKCRTSFPYEALAATPHGAEHPEPGSSGPGEISSPNPSATASQLPHETPSTAPSDDGWSVILFVCGVAVLGILFYGWSTVISMLLAAFVLAFGLAGVGFAVVACETRTSESDRASFWWLAVICAVMAIFFWTWTTPRNPKGDTMATEISRRLGESAGKVVGQ